MKRKSLLLLFIVISSSQIVNSQIKKGSVFLGGQVGFERSDSESDPNKTKQTTYFISPALGIFTRDNLVWGGDILVAGGNSDNNNHPQSQLNVGVGVFVRQYFPVVNRLYLFGQGRFGVSYINNKVDNGTVKAKSRGSLVAVSIYPGISYALKKNIHLESGFNNLASIGYSRSKTNYEGAGAPSQSKSSSFGINAGFSNAAQFSLGIRFLLEKSAG